MNKRMVIKEEIKAEIRERTSPEIGDLLIDLLERMSTKPMLEKEIKGKKRLILNIPDEEKRKFGNEIMFKIRQMMKDGTLEQ
jgi:hypothetical protein